MATCGELAKTACSFSIATFPPPTIKSCNSSSFKKIGKSLFESVFCFVSIPFCADMVLLRVMIRCFRMRNKGKSINYIGLFF